MSSSYLISIIKKRRVLLVKGKQLLTGILAGILISTPIHMYANDIKTKVEAWATPYVQFVFDDEITPLPLGYTILNYEGRTYVPTRFVAEQLEAEVAWNEATQTISIKAKPLPEPEPAPVPECPDKEKNESEGKKDESEDKVEYRQIPQSKTFKNLTSTLTALIKDDQSTRIYLAIENKQGRPVQLKQTTAELIVDGKTYELADEPSFRWDTRWFQDIRQDETVEGYLTFPALKDGVDEATVKFALIYNDGSDEKHELEYNIKF